MLFGVVVVAERILAILKVEMLFLLALEVLQLVLELKLLPGRVCFLELVMVLLHDSIISCHSAQNGELIEMGGVAQVSG